MKNLRLEILIQALDSTSHVQINSMLLIKYLTFSSCVEEWGYSKSQKEGCFPFCSLLSLLILSSSICSPTPCHSLPPFQLFYACYNCSHNLSSKFTETGWRLNQQAFLEGQELEEWNTESGNPHMPSYLDLCCYIWGIVVNMHPVPLFYRMVILGTQRSHSSQSHN